MPGRREIVFVVNPVAGLGGPLGYKGTDEELGRRLLLTMETEPPAYRRARQFISALAKLGCIERVYTAPRLGYELLRDYGLGAEVVYEPPEWPTRSRDTYETVIRGLERGARIVVFVGGDGTARIVYDAVRDAGLLDETVVLGVPAGVKMYGSVYAVRPAEAARVLCDYIEGRGDTCEAEVMDIDEEAFRRNELRARLYGIVRVPCSPAMVGSSKQPSPSTGEEEENKKAIARYIVERYVRECTIIVLGPGTTTAAIAREMGVPKTLLGVDVYHGRRVIALDVNEETLYRILSEHRGRKVIIVSPIGGQGFILGRGNQQISPRIVRLVGPENIIVVATRSKMQGLGWRLRVDTGDPEVDKLLQGYRRVVVDYNEEVMVRVE